VGVEDTQRILDMVEVAPAARETNRRLMNQLNRPVS
jgi:hypothetical protein